MYNSLAMPMQISDDANVRNFASILSTNLKKESDVSPSYNAYPCLWLITWDSTQPIATRPLAIQKDGTWYTYGWDLTKNICEIFGQNGYIRSTYAYTPFGAVTANGDVTQPIQWSSEYYDNELALVYYNYRHYNPTDGRWINRDPIAEQGGWNLYGFVENRIFVLDSLGFQCCKQEINYFSSNCFKQKRECGFLTPTGQVGCIDSTILTKIKKEIKRINNIKDKCNRRCYCVEMISEPINLEGLYAFSSYYDKIILLAHSRGYYNNYTILIDKDVFVHSSELPKNIEVLGCHLYGKLNKREKIEGGTKSNIVSILQILDDLLFKRLSKYTAKENCEITYKIGLLTTTIKSYHIPNDVVKNPHTI